MELWSEIGSPMDRSVIESGEVVRTRSKIFDSLVGSFTNWVKKKQTYRGLWAGKSAIRFT